MKYSSCMNRLGCMLTVTALLMGLTSCEERFSESVPAAGEGNPVESFSFFRFCRRGGGYALSVPADTRAGEDGEGGAFSARLLPAAKTRTGEVTRPDALYQFHLMQYNQSGNLMGSVQYKETGPNRSKFLYRSHFPHLAASHGLPVGGDSPRAREYDTCH